MPCSISGILQGLPQLIAVVGNKQEQMLTKPRMGSPGCQLDDGEWASDNRGLLFIKRYSQLGSQVSCVHKAFLANIFMKGLARFLFLTAWSLSHSCICVQRHANRDCSGNHWAATVSDTYQSESMNHSIRQLPGLIAQTPEYIMIADIGFCILKEVPFDCRFLQHNSVNALV